VLAALPVDAQSADLGSPPTASTSPTELSVVKVFSTRVLPDFQKPWANMPPSELTGSGVVIPGKRILTNAHVVLYARQVQIQDSLSGDKILASVETIAPGIDLALLKLENESFFDSHPPVEVSDVLPKEKDQVLVYGYPTGGNNLSITKGIVSRIEFRTYQYPTMGLRIQIDAAINPGNSGGPAMVDDKLVGLANSSLMGTQNIGYLIPAEEIQLFLKESEGGKYTGKPLMYDEFQTLENPALRSFLRLDSSVHGVIVLKPFHDGPTYPLKKWDVITKIGDTSIDDQGMILINGTRLWFEYMIQKMTPTATIPLTVVRDGKEIAVTVMVSPDCPRLVPFLEGAAPRYFIFGPVVFSVATDDFLEAILGSKESGQLLNVLSWIGSPLLARRSEELPQVGDELVVVSSPLFPHVLSRGYSNPQFKVVKAIDGVAVRSLSQLVEIIRDSREAFITIEFEERWAETIVLPREAALAATDEILNDSGIRNQGTPDILQVWRSKGN
jgi:S1-C subfamily serine protease